MQNYKTHTDDKYIKLLYFFCLFMIIFSYLNIVDFLYFCWIFDMPCELCIAIKYVIDEYRAGDSGKTALGARQVFF